MTIINYFRVKLKELNFEEDIVELCLIGLQNNYTFTTEIEDWTDNSLDYYYSTLEQEWMLMQFCLLQILGNIHISYE